MGKTMDEPDACFVKEFTGTSQMKCTRKIISAGAEHRDNNDAEHFHKTCDRHELREYENGHTWVGNDCSSCAQVTAEPCLDQTTSSCRLSDAGEKCSSEEAVNSQINREVDPVSSQPIERDLPDADIGHLTVSSSLHSEIKRDLSSNLNSPSSFQTAAAGSINDKPQGARPKITATRRINKNSTSNKDKKSVRWANKTNEFIDETTFTSYRDHLLNLRTPQTNSANAAVEAVLFMCESTENITINLAVMVMKLLWLKHGLFPKAQQLYTAITEMKYDEKVCVLQFIELCKTVQGGATVKTLLDSTDHHLSQQVNIQTYKEATNRTPLPGSENNDPQNLSGDLNVEISKQEKSSYNTNEPLQTTHIQVPGSASQLEENTLGLHFPSDSELTSIHHNQPNLKKDLVTQEQPKMPLPIENLHKTKIQALQREQTYLKKALTCVKCQKNPREVTFLPCGHFSLCSGCSESLNICPVCNKQALAEVKTFLS